MREIVEGIRRLGGKRKNENGVNIVIMQKNSQKNVLKLFKKYWVYIYIYIYMHTLYILLLSIFKQLSPKYTQ